jgi:hypothetical protein
LRRYRVSRIFSPGLLESLFELATNKRLEIFLAKAN